ncbi:hypothetical protein IHE44_0004418 [Lamprotornis superbus]|uniref:Uncharacterized protein n=1 Tax=Lamprotornis superbus TaxID=245042 RepID=A0A835TV57_9PASS|nr:hypothetical protein IHE44_0004418 [Lamprotornis superbus]
MLVNTSCVWRQFIVMVLPTGGHHLFPGKTEEEVREIDKAMYHDWRMVPKHEEEAFKKFTPVPEETIRFLPYPPLLRAMILAQWQKEGKPIMKEPVIDLEKVLASPQERTKKKATGTPWLQMLLLCQRLLEGLVWVWVEGAQELFSSIDQFPAEMPAPEQNKNLTTPKAYGPEMKAVSSEVQGGHSPRQEPLQLSRASLQPCGTAATGHMLTALCCARKVLICLHSQIQRNSAGLFSSGSPQQHRDEELDSITVAMEAELCLSHGAVGNEAAGRFVTVVITIHMDDPTGATGLSRGTSSFTALRGDHSKPDFQEDYKRFALLRLNVNILQMLMAVGMVEPQCGVQADGNPHSISNPCQLSHLALPTRMGIKGFLKEVNQSTPDSIINHSHATDGVVSVAKIHQVLMKTELISNRTEPLL